MATYLLDTNHVSRLISERHPFLQRVLHEAEFGNTFVICVPVLTEFLFGIGILSRAGQNLAIWRQLAPRFPCYRPAEREATLAAELQIALRRRGWQLETVDALIAAVALQHELILLTTDKDFLAVPGLQIENWLA